ncbi:hypothetical protein KY084_05375 [Stakelama sp. CBK3Z-3]|uniref:DUF4129 domain-containing protein n=1 Tax=Stakelama flava TaxID=2860338 RepID=A0ABS6XJD9_9SPHN|nr:hypothetical protein [Stakelama flava]MBW4330302.1 hypothetical protein [Stakelama flava]
MTATGNSAADLPTDFPDDRALAGAHHILLNDHSIQFDLPAHVEKRPPTPQWLRWLIDSIGDFVQWVGPAWKWILIAVGTALLITLCLAIFPTSRRWIAGLLHSRRRGGETPVEGWRPDSETAHSLLEEADRLAAQGAYDAAVRLILHRSIEDIGRWRGDLLRPSFTSRDIAALSALPGRAATIFADIAASVEKSLFARHPLGRSDWERARSEYADFALKPA